MEGLLSAKAAAKWLGLSPTTLAIMRTQGRSPRWCKLSPGRSGRVLYRLEDLQEYVSARMRENTVVDPCSIGVTSEAATAAGMRRASSQSGESAEGLP